ncbi:MAG: hypothetical protein GOV01_02595 [Candidatus Altiarchaeota archaeon]|nr:hypothetical protein [Candidatus Altiarchaeota archaeon]
MVNLSDLQEEIMRNKKARGFNTTDVGLELIFMTEELGELAKAYVKSNRKFASEINNREDILNGVADVLIYGIAICAMMGEDVGKVLENKIEFNKTRTHNRHA